MRENNTIAEAARLALSRLGGPSSIRDIYNEIIKSNLYQFNTDVPEHVLRTEIRRRTEGVERVDARESAFFRLMGDELYDILEESNRRRTNVGAKRIRRASDKEDVVKLLTAESSGLFREIWRAMLFSAVLGFRSKRREQLGSVEPGKGIDQNSFGNNPVWPGILYLIGLTDSDSTNVLRSSEEAENERIAIFEEYANGGLAILKQALANKECNVDNIAFYITNELKPKQTESPNLQITI